MSNPNPTHKFPKGESANPHGRPKGSRNKLGEDFLKALSADWAEFGGEALAECRNKSPSQYVRVVASLLPKEILVKNGNALADAIENLDDDQLASVISALGDIAGGGTGTGQPTSEGEPSKLH